MTIQKHWGSERQGKRRRHEVRALTLIARTKSIPPKLSPFFSFCILINKYPPADWSKTKAQASSPNTPPTLRFRVVRQFITRSSRTVVLKGRTSKPRPTYRTSTNMGIKCSKNIVTIKIKKEILMILVGNRYCIELLEIEVPHPVYYYGGP